MTLSDLKVGDSVRIVQYVGGASAYRKRLLSMGLTLGAQLTVSHIAPLGDPIEIKVRGYALSLRKSEASCLQVVPVENSQ